MAWKNDDLHLFYLRVHSTKNKTASAVAMIIIGCCRAPSPLSIAPLSCAQHKETHLRVCRPSCTTGSTMDTQIHSERIQGVL